jgi:hypothetical protein
MKLDLSVVIPVLDEEERLPLLLRDLAAQREIAMEVVVADGGSRDGTRGAFDAARRSFPFPLAWRDAPRGRGAQMNAGTEVAGAPDLLFLHADSRIADPLLLARARDHLLAERARLAPRPVAGHFGISFERRGAGDDFGYYLLEARSRRNDPMSVNGDQGQWLARDHFRGLGGFDETLPFFEDARLSAAVARTGCWTTLPGLLTASARRFETEGLARRIAANTLLRATAAMGMEPFLAQAPDLYRAAGEDAPERRLAVAPLCRAAHRHLPRGGMRAWGKRWLAAGGFARENAWLLAFWRDCRRNWRASVPAGEARAPRADRWEKRFAAGAGGRLGRAAFAPLAAALFYAFWGFAALRWKDESAPERGGVRGPR